MSWDDNGQEWHETVAMQEEYEMEKRRDFRAEIQSEFQHSDQQYCAYCLGPRIKRDICCEERHWLTFAELPKDDQDTLVDAEIAQYEEWSRK